MLVMADLVDPSISRAAPHGLLQRGRDVLADVVRPDRQLSMAPVDQYGQLDRPWPAEVGDRVQGARIVRPEKSTSSTRITRAGRDRPGQLGRADRAGSAQPQVVAVERDVERADRDLDGLEGPDPLGQAARRAAPTGGDAEQDRSSAPSVFSRI
jgi:hypothetical protein